MEYLAEKLACSSCIIDPFLKERILSDGHVNTCSYCSSSVSCVPLSKVAGWVEAALKQNYQEGEHVPCFDGDDRLSYDQKGEEFLDVLSFHFGAAEALFNDVLSVITEEREAPFSCDARYVEFDGYRDAAMREWEEIKHDLRHRSRYFNDRVKSFFGNLLEDIKTAEAGGFFWNEVVRLFEPSEGHTIYRARGVNCEDELFNQSCDRARAPASRKSLRWKVKF